MKRREEATFQFLDEIGPFVAAMTKLKTRLIAEGWSDAAAEQIVITMLARGESQ